MGGLGRGDAYELHLRPPRLSDIRSAAGERAQQLAQEDALFAPWAEADIGEPMLVRDLSGAPSYWLVPVEHGDRAIGFVRVTQAGRAVAAGALYRDAERLGEAPRVVTGITAAEARERAAEATEGAVVEDPVYVHDGPPGREAWLVRVREADGTVRTLFVGPGGLYERASE